MRGSPTPRALNAVTGAQTHSIPNMMASNSAPSPPRRPVVREFVLWCWHVAHGCVFHLMGRQANLFRAPERLFRRRDRASAQRDLFSRVTIVSEKPRVTTTAPANDATTLRPRREASHEASQEPPLFSLLMPTFNPPVGPLRAALASVAAQTSSDWEIVIVDDASPARPDATIEDVLGSGVNVRLIHRSVQGGVAEATETARTNARGKWLVFLDQDDVIAPDLLEEFAKAICTIPSCVVIYGDECHIDDEGRAHTAHLKPAINPALLLGQNYINHPCAIRADVAAAAGGLRRAFDGAQDLDLLLRVLEISPLTSVVHVPGVRYGWRQSRSGASISQSRPRKSSDAGRRAVEESLARQGISGEVTAYRGGWRRVRPRAPEGAVTIVIPSRDNATCLRRCLMSLRRTARSEAFNLVLIDHENHAPAARTLFEEARDAKDMRATVLPWSGPFNYAAMMNAAVDICETSEILLLNDDVEALSKGWLAAMRGWLAFKDVGVVGAKLIYPSGLLQHTGLSIGIGKGAGSRMKHASVWRQGPFGRLDLARDVSAVTGACLLTRKDLWRDLGGLDPSTFPVSYNDVDYCLRAAGAGMRTVWCPEATLVHHESFSRRRNRTHAQDSSEELNFRDRWAFVYRDDPLDHPAFDKRTESLRVTSELQTGASIRRTPLGHAASSEPKT